MGEFQTLQFQNSLTPWCASHCKVKLLSVHHTEELDFFENVKIIHILYFYYCYATFFFVNLVMLFYHFYC